MYFSRLLHLPIKEVHEIQNFNSLLENQFLIRHQFIRKYQATDKMVSYCINRCNCAHYYHILYDNGTKTVTETVGK